MERIANDGQLSYRTKLMELPRAAAFARALGANDLFTAVEIETSSRAKSERKYFVTFLPSNPERVQDMLDRQQDARAERAAEQEFTFLLDKDGGRPYLLCWSHTSGEVYDVDVHGRSCSCPDHEFRCKPNGLRCKHALAAVAAMAEGEVGSW